ncbi:M56 family metallopeptidase [Rugosimonospora africana]|uniref:Peptidase M56 domain-containing protein n=1 Tax=Rugosimonospora africana TaxID=556532 RepID=A0A8J3VUE5_9ACTN|nr:M56 family metallopeptidase [Rugosimonospora africana]GIH19437.1 hypothetical protein Raf01_76090 [Rugosimonospora africana]
MNTAVASCLAACLIFAAAGPYLARALPPHLAVRLLVPSVVLATGCGVFVLGAVAFTWLGQLGDVAEYGAWSPHRLHLLDPVPTQLAIAAGALLVLAAGWAAARTVGTARMWYSMHRACRDLDDGTDSPLLVVDSTEPRAFTTPGPWRPRIVVTTGMLAALDAPARRILLAHERSHCAHRHTCWTLTADLAAAVNPLLHPTARAIRDATERWADEDAARGNDRRLVATTIAHVALLATRSPTPTGTAAASGGRVPARVRALRRPPPRVRARPLAALIALTLTIALGTVAVERTGESLFEHAERSASATQEPRP